MRRRLRLRAATESRFAIDNRKLTVIASVCLVAIALFLVGTADPSEPEPEPTTSASPDRTGAEPGPEPTAGSGTTGGDDTAPEASLDPALEVPASMRTVTVVVRDPLGLGAGDTVDVVATLDPDVAPGASAALRVVRRAVVRSVAATDAGPGEVAVSLIVTPEDVGRVEFASRHGTVALSLAPAEDDGVAPSEPLPGGGSAGGGAHSGDDEDHDE